MDRLRRSTLCIMFLLCLWTPRAWALTEIQNLRHWAAPQSTRVVIDTNEEIKYTVEKTVGKVQLNLGNAVLSTGMSREYVLNEPGITKISLTPLAPGNVRMELFLTENVDTKIFKLKKFQDKPCRLVIDITLPEVEKEKIQVREQVKVVNKNKIIVIDPGHGGEDPGATGYRGTMEKNVVLQIGKKLRDLLNMGEGAQAFLTREGDYYVPFKKRLNIARELGADLFISIHADAALNRVASGSSVYCLSTGGASSEAAKILARKENMADIIGGTLGDGNSNSDSAPIILNMFQTNTINQSKTFGSKVLNSLSQVNDIKFPRVQEAPFRVLKFPEIPAILIETAYISNPQEELNLRDGKFQADIAKSIAGTVREFLALPESAVLTVALTDDRVKPDARKYPAAERQSHINYVYTVKKGDTLAKIAGQNRTNIGVLLKLNKLMLLDPLYVGRVLRLPVSEPEGKAGKVVRKAEMSIKPSPVQTVPRLYKVRRGDTVKKIASRYQTPVSAILKLNHMQLHEPLYVDRDLKLPRPQS